MAGDPTNQPLTAFAGHSRRWQALVSNADGTAADLTGMRLLFRAVPSAGAGPAIVKDSAIAGITFPDPARGVAVIALLPADTQMFTSAASYRYALAEYPGPPEKELLAYGLLTITPMPTTQSG